MLALHSLYAKRLANAWLKFATLQISGVYLFRGSRICASTEIGGGTRINGPMVAKGHGKAVIGKYCAIGDGLRLITSNHSLQQMVMQNALQLRLTGETATVGSAGIRIGHDVWIGDNVIVLPGVEIGDGAVVGAGAVVTRSVAPYAIVAGNPAREIGQRFAPKVVKCLLSLQWWNWPAARMKNYPQLFGVGFAALSDKEKCQMIDEVMGSFGDA